MILLEQQNQFIYLIRNITMDSQHLQLQWSSLGLHHYKTDKSILHNLNGTAASGDFLCIMGQSGAGKSSFLSILTARISKSTRDFNLQGSIRLNQKEYGVREFGKVAAYVRQDDILMGTLTVKESFQFQANLRLHKKSDEQKASKIKEIILQLNLGQCMNVLVGGHFSKSISGGQRKRVAIGIELLANPGCLVLDEPTSGLDSHNAFKIIKILKNLSNEGKMVIATLHQPSSLMFKEMDKLFLLSNGQTLFFGKANSIVEYMKSLNIKVNPRMNPADFFMVQVSEYKKSLGYTTPMTSNNWEKYLKERQHINPAQKKQESTMINQQQFQSAPISVQFQSLIKRNLKSYFRTPSNLAGKFISLIIVPLYMATLYHGIGGRVPDLIEGEQAVLKFLNEFAAFLFMLAFFCFASSTYDTVLTFSQEKQLALKENSARLYSLAWYFLSKILIEVPISIFSSVFGTLIIYFVCELDKDFGVLSQFCLVLILISLSGFFMGTLTGIIFNTEAEAGQILPLIMIPVVIFGGLVINLNDIPTYIRWMQYLSPIRHGYSCLMFNQLSSNTMHQIVEYQKFRDYVGINGKFNENIIYESVLLIGLALFSIMGMYLKRRAL